MMVIILIIKVGILIIVAMNHVMQYVKSELKCINQTSTLTSGFDFSFYKSPCHQERQSRYRSSMSQCEPLKMRDERVPIHSRSSLRPCRNFRLWCFPRTRWNGNWGPMRSTCDLQENGLSCLESHQRVRKLSGWAWLFCQTSAAPPWHFDVPDIASFQDGYRMDTWQSLCHYSASLKGHLDVGSCS
jgi:hypothetical protein